jgi:hypothetical protein
MRSSIYRPKGTILVKNIESVTRDVIKKFLIKHVIPAIKSKWPPREKYKTIFIQQDNARPHVAVDDADVVAAGTAGGWNIRLMCQPPKSPDFNVLDLGYFSSIQSLQNKENANNVSELVQVVHKSFTRLPKETLEDTFLTFQKVLECAIEHNGGNQYKLPHINKKKLRKENKLPITFRCDDKIYMNGKKA